MLISGWQQALTLVAVLIPGFVFQGVQRSRIGPSPEDRDLTARLIRALAVSVGFLLAYLVAFGQGLLGRLLEPATTLDHARPLAALAFTLVFAVPAICGHLVASFQTRQAYNHTTGWGTIWTTANPDDGSMTWAQAIFSRESNYNPIPTAWDFATSSVQANTFVRVLNADGLFIGGRVTPEAYFTSYPEPRDIFIDEAWELDEAGNFIAPLHDRTGIWIPCTDAQLVQFIAPEPHDSTDPDAA